MEVENTKKINLSFDDKSLRFKRYGTRTIVTLRSYFKFSKMEKYFDELGFNTLPTEVVNILKKYGFSRDHNLNGWVCKTTGVAVHDGVEEDNQIKANRVALCKAKSKAYLNAFRVVEEVLAYFTNVTDIFLDATSKFSKLYVDESEALDRVSETGYCRP